MSLRNPFTPANMLAAYRGNANDYMREQVSQFLAMSPSDQREFLFFTIANMAIAQSAIVDFLPDVQKPDHLKQ